MNLHNLSLADLRALQESIKQELKTQEEQEIANARSQILAIAQGIGVPLKDLIEATYVRAKFGPVTIQYRNPENANDQWAGRGRPPKWLKVALDAGKTLDSMRV
jgi:DNA-binding protein H-NS